MLTVISEGTPRKPSNYVGIGNAIAVACCEEIGLPHVKQLGVKRRRSASGRPTSNWHFVINSSFRIDLGFLKSNRAKVRTAHRKSVCCQCRPC
jgi:hypothetical protein